MTRKANFFFFVITKENLNTVLKVLRFGRVLGTLLNLQKIIKDYRENKSLDPYNPNQSFYYTLSVSLSLFNLTLFFFFDHFVFLAKVK